MKYTPKVSIIQLFPDIKLRDDICSGFKRSQTLTVPAGVTVLIYYVNVKHVYVTCNFRRALSSEPAPIFVQWLFLN